MSQPGFHHPVSFGVSIKPLQEHMHLSVNLASGRCLEVDAFFPDRPGDDLHWSAAVIAPGTHPDSSHPAPAGRKQGRMPSEQPFDGKRLIVVPRGVQHQLDHSLHVPIYVFQSSDVYAESTRDRRTNLLHVQMFALDFTTL